jgi:hypothetical protein
MTTITSTNTAQQGRTEIKWGEKGVFSFHTKINSIVFYRIILHCAQCHFMSASDRVQVNYR